MRKRKSKPSLPLMIEKLQTVALSTKSTLEQSSEAQDYNTALFKYAEFIATIAKTGTLGEKADAAIALQKQDLRKAQDKDDPTYLQQATDAIANFDAALHVFDKLTLDPAWYREYAAGFLPKNKSHGLPYDEFLQALSSQNSREGNRDASINSFPGEDALYASRRVLITSLIQAYARAQERVIAGGALPSDDARIRI